MATNYLFKTSGHHYHNVIALTGSTTYCIPALFPTDQTLCSCVYTVFYSLYIFEYILVHAMPHNTSRSQSKHNLTKPYIFHVRIMKIFAACKLRYTQKPIDVRTYRPRCPHITHMHNASTCAHI